MRRRYGPPQPITELGSWEAGLLEGIVAATAEGERAEAEELAAELETFGFAVRWEPGAVVLTHLWSGRVLRRSLAVRWGMELRVRRDEDGPKG